MEALRQFSKYKDTVLFLSTFCVTLREIKALESHPIYGSPSDCKSVLVLPRALPWAISILALQAMSIIHYGLRITYEVFISIDSTE